MEKKFIRLSRDKQCCSEILFTWVLIASKLEFLLKEKLNSLRFVVCVIFDILLQRNQKLVGNLDVVLCFSY